MFILANQYGVIHINIIGGKGGGLLYPIACMMVTIAVLFVLLCHPYWMDTGQCRARSKPGKSKHAVLCHIDACMAVPCRSHPL